MEAQLYISARDLWAAVLRDPAYKGIEESAECAMVKPYMEKAPEILRNDLHTLVTLEVIAATKIAFLRYCLEYGLGQHYKYLLGRAIENGLVRAIEGLTPLVEELGYTLRLNCVTEEEIMSSKVIGLNEANLNAWKEGVLTVGDLLLTQPSVILKNS